MAGDLDDHHLARFGVAGVAPANQHVIAALAIEWHGVALAQAIALEAADEMPCRRCRRSGAAPRLIARQRVELAAHQDERAVGEQLPEGTFGACPLQARDAEQANDLVCPRGAGEPIPEAGQQFGFVH